MPSPPRLSDWVKPDVFVVVTERHGPAGNHEYNMADGPMMIKMVADDHRAVRLTNFKGELGGYIQEAALTKLTATTWREAQRGFLEVIVLPLLEELKHEVSLRLTTARSEIARLVRYPTDEDELTAIIEKIAAADKEGLVAAIKAMESVNSAGLWKVVDELSTKIQSADSMLAAGVESIRA